jgi:alpha-ribazole phosphatase
MIYLLRHGEIENSYAKRFIGQIDIPLSESGREQAGLWRERLSEIEFDAIYSSDLSRCLETAEIIAGPRKIHILNKFREISLGEWEGLHRHEVKERFPDEWKARGMDMGYRPPKGESFNDLNNRVIPVFNEIAGSGSQNMLLITHAGVIRVILCHILGMPLNRLFTLVQDYAGINLIDNQKKPLQLVAMNRTIRS